ncbi:MAG: efflux RND transporter periplasmic adaptor subunit, partial [Chitinophagales bacterium]
MKYKIVLIISLGVLLTQCQSKARGTEKDEKKQGLTRYEMAEVKPTGLSSSIKLPGQLSAYQEVSIFPRVNGYVKYVYVDIGSKVTRGQLLMSIEAPELAQTTMQSKEKYIRTMADLAIDKEHYNRLQEAAQTPGAVSPLELSSAKSKVESDSAVSNAAKSNWEMQKTM